MNDEPKSDIQISIDLLREEVAKLNTQRFFSAHNTWIGLILFNLVRGLMFGLGSFLGATILVYVLIQILGNIDFIPILGEWAQQIIGIIQTK